MKCLTRAVFPNKTGSWGRTSDLRKNITANFNTGAFTSQHNALILTTRLTQHPLSVSLTHSTERGCLQNS